MAAFLLRFSDGTTLTIDGLSVTEANRDRAVSRSFESAAVAMVAFEAIAGELEAGGHAAKGECQPELPGALADLGCDDDRTWILVRDGSLVGVHLYDADPVGYRDGLRGVVLQAPSWGRFDPETAPFEVLGVHALRRLLAHPATARCPRFGIQAWGPYIAPLLDRLVSAGCGAWLTHLWVGDPWDGNRGEPSTEERPLGSELPELRLLEAPFWSWPRWSGAVLPQLERLALGGGPAWVEHGKARPATPPLRQILDGVAERAPALRHLAIRHRPWNRVDLEELVAHPLIQRLDTLELFNIHHAFDHDAFLESRPRLTHVSRIVLGSHLITQETQARYGDWPAVTFASYDRRELTRYDAEWQGQPAVDSSPCMLLARGSA